MIRPARAERIARRARHPRWKLPPLRVDMSACVNCDACIGACPAPFGAVFRHGIDVVIIPELCSGCGKCVPVCPVDCIHPDPDWSPAPPAWWDEPLERDVHVPHRP